MFTAILSATCVPVLYFRLVRSFPPKRKPYSSTEETSRVFQSVRELGFMFAFIRATYTAPPSRAISSGSS